MELYDQNHIRDFYDDYGELETKRWEKSLIEKVKYLIHNHYLLKHVSKGGEILELGAGSGMFTKEIVKYASGFVVSDLSSVQLKLNKQRAEAEGYLDKISGWQIVDICDLSEFEDHRFDIIVCYGGPLSYVFEKNEVALNEMKRVLKPGGLALISVMNLWGTLNQYFDSILFSISKEDNEKIVKTGNLHPSSYTDSDHYCHMYRSEELVELIERCGFKIVELSASNCLSAKRTKELETLENDKEKWDYFIELEISACRSPGMIESGTHIIAVVQSSS